MAEIVEGLTWSKIAGVLSEGPWVRGPGSAALLLQDMEPMGRVFILRAGAGSE